MNRVTLKSITTKIGAGATPTGGQNTYQTNGIALIRSQNVHDFIFSKNGLAFIDDKQAKALNNVTVEENDVLLNITGDSIARVCIVPNEILPARVNQHVSIIRCNKEIDSIYVHYYLQYMKPYLLKICGVGGTRNALTKEAIEKLEIELKANHSAIAAVLSALDAKIELNNRINAELEAIAKTLYDFWFVQFDFPDANGKPYKTSGEKMAYNPTLKREIPEGWEVNTLAAWIGSDKTGDWGKEAREGNYTLQVDCIRGADVNGLNGNGKVDTPNRFILHKNSSKLISAYDLIIEISGGSPTQSTGRMAFLTKETLERFDYPVISSNFCKAISLVDNRYFYNFVYLWNAIYENGELFGWEGKTSGIKNLLFDAFVSKYHVCLPPASLAEDFYIFVEPLQQKKQKNLKENQQLSQLRDWLLPMLMKGQVKVQ